MSAERGRVEGGGCLEHLKFRELCCEVWTSALLLSLLANYITGLSPLT